MLYNSTSIGYELLIFYGYFVSWFVPLIIVFGSVGTILSIIVLMRRRSTQPEIRCWFLALSSNDLIGLIFGLLTLYLSRLNLITSVPILQLDLKSANGFLCYFNTNAIFFSLLLSSWLQAGISVLRAVSTSQPLRLRSMITATSGRIYLLCIIATALTVSLLLVNITIEYKEVRVMNLSQGYRCRLKRNFHDLFYFLSLIVRVIVPVLLLLLSSIFICKSLGRQHFNSPLEGQSRNPVNARGHLSTALNQNHRNISCMLLWMNLAFLLANMPYETFKLLYRNYDISSIQTKSEMHFFIYSRIMDKFLNILVYLNQSSNWLFYFMLGKKFRNELVTLFGCTHRDLKAQGCLNPQNLNHADLNPLHTPFCHRKILTQRLPSEKSLEDE